MALTHIQCSGARIGQYEFSANIRLRFDESPGARSLPATSALAPRGLVNWATGV
jgi:hypothetical protein